MLRGTLRFVGFYARSQDRLKISGLAVEEDTNFSNKREIRKHEFHELIYGFL